MRPNLTIKRDRSTKWTRFLVCCGGLHGSALDTVKNCQAIKGHKLFVMSLHYLVVVVVLCYGCRGVVVV